MRRWLIATLAVAFGLTVHAATVNLNPGKWRTTTETKVMAGAAPQVDTETEVSCMEESGFDPVADMSEDGMCQVRDVVQTSAEFSAKVTCQNGPMPMTGEMKYTMTNTTFDGTFAFQMGNQFSVDGKTTGERIGDCD